MKAATTIAGIDIKEYDEIELAKWIGRVKVTLRVMYMFVTVVILFIIGGYIKDILDYGFAYFIKHFVDYYLWGVYLIFGLGLVSGLIVMPLLRYKKGIEVELQRRYSDNANMTHLTKMSERSSKKFIIFIAVLCILAAIGGLILGLTMTNTDEDGCRNCGRDVPLVAGYDYCEDCYEGFGDWQDRIKD